MARRPAKDQAALDFEGREGRPAQSSLAADIDVAEAERRYLGGETLKEIGQALGVSGATIHNYLRRKGVAMRRAGTACLPVRESAFDVVNQESAYWAGFLMADGCVADPQGRAKRIILGLHLDDLGHLEKFKEFLGAESKIVRRVASCSLTVTSNALAESLARFGVVPRKSLTARALILDSNRDFWRGVIDGDGCLSTRRAGLPRLGLVGSESCVSQFLDFCRDVSPGIAAQPRRRAKVWQASISGAAAWDVIGELYGNCAVALDRKLAKAKVILGRPRPTPRRRLAPIA